MSAAANQNGSFLQTCQAFLRGLRGSATAAPSNPLGIEGESLAAAYLSERGYRILARNARVRGGEADLLAIDPDGQTIVLVEVKSRRMSTKGHASVAPPPESSVHAVKRRKLRRILQRLIAANRWHDRPARIDVVAVEFLASADHIAPIVRHTIDAVPLREPARS